MSTEIICATIALLGTLLSALISYLVSRQAADKEIEKLKLSWTHDDGCMTDEDYAELATSVIRFSQAPTPENQSIAMEKAYALRLKETVVMSVYLKRLYRDLESCDPRKAVYTFEDIIEERHRVKSGGKTVTEKTIQALGLVKPEKHVYFVDIPKKK